MITTPQKRQLIADIRACNPNASGSFLSQFDAEALKVYLESLARAARQTRPAMAIRKSDRYLIAC